MSRRVLVTGLWHETNTFAATPTDLAAFRDYQLRQPAYTRGQSAVPARSAREVAEG